MNTTTCETCGTTKDETIAQHLEAHHVNEMFKIDFDPATNEGVIRERTQAVAVTTADDVEVLGFVCACGVSVLVPTPVISANARPGQGPWQVVCPVCAETLFHNGAGTLQVVATGPADPVPASDDIRRMDIDEFRTAGYLQEVNRTFLHPLGLALEVRTDGEGRAVALGGVWDYRDDPEGMNYGEGVIDLAKVDRVAAEWDDKTGTRQAALGYVVQPPPPAST